MIVIRSGTLALHTRWVGVVLLLAIGAACVPVAQPGHVMVRTKRKPGESEWAFKSDRDACDSTSRGYSRLYGECMQARGYEVVVTDPQGRQVPLADLALPAPPPTVVVVQPPAPPLVNSAPPPVTIPPAVPAAPRAVLVGPDALSQWLTPEQKKKYVEHFAINVVKTAALCSGAKKKN
ncbi:hypothetical protein BZM27_09415 [Paraburkholderia steynii]|uniref:Uncharacterized protein n=1 Tax=Paraburkholderia steynii TaxID=1245441 RepID=A0A4R0XNC3_9BURK|nr:hypothetical protein BZM27_09415 [Paraburkholderia steynii]